MIPDNSPPRQHPRIYVEVPVAISSPMMGGDFSAVLTRQLGCGGCMLIGDEYFESGRVLTLRLDLNGTPVTAISQILYEYPEKDDKVLSGVKFLDLTHEGAGALEAFIGERLPPKE